MKVFWLAVDFLGIGWAIAMSGVLIAAFYTAVSRGLDSFTFGFDKLGEATFEVYWFAIWWLMGLVAFGRAIRRILKEK